MKQVYRDTARRLISEADRALAKREYGYPIGPELIEMMLDRIWHAGLTLVRREQAIKRRKAAG